MRGPREVRRALRRLPCEHLQLSRSGRQAFAASAARHRGRAAETKRPYDLSYARIRGVWPTSRGKGRIRARDRGLRGRPAYLPHGRNRYFLVPATAIYLRAPTPSMSARRRGPAAGEEALRSRTRRDWARFKPGARASFAFAHLAAGDLAGGGEGCQAGARACPAARLPSGRGARPAHAGTGARPQRSERARTRRRPLPRGAGDRGQDRDAPRSRPLPRRARADTRRTGGVRRPNPNSRRR